jgi:hypothetical protein
MVHSTATPHKRIGRQEAAARSELAIRPAGTPHQLLTREEAAAYLNIKPQTLAVWHTTRRYNLPVIKVGRSVRYLLADLERFVQKSRVEGAA